MQDYAHPDTGYGGACIISVVGALYLEAVRSIQGGDIQLDRGECLRTEHNVRRSRSGARLGRLAEDDVLEPIVINVLK